MFPFTLLILVFLGNPSLSTTALLVVNIVDTDDNCPVFNPKEYNVTIEENRPLNLTIVTVHATDVDTVGETSLEYAIRSGNLKNTFQIGRFSGMLIVIFSLDPVRTIAY